MGREGGDHLLAETGENIDYPAGEVAGRQHLTKQNGGVRLGRRGERHHGVAASDGGGDQRDQREQRSGVGRDDADDAHGLGHGEVEIRRGDRVHVTEDLFVFIGPAGVVNEAVNRRGDLAGGGGGLGSAEDERGGHLAAAGLDHLSEAVEDLAAVVSGAFGPTRPGLGGGLDGVAQVFAGALRDIGVELAGGIFERVNACALGADERAANVNFRGLGNRESGHDAKWLSG